MIMTAVDISSTATGHDLSDQTIREELERQSLPLQKMQAWRPTQQTCYQNIVQ